MDELTQVKTRLDSLEQEIFKNKSVSLQSVTNFLDTTRGNFQIPIRDSLPTTCRVSELVEVAGIFYACIAQDTWLQFTSRFGGTGADGALSISSGTTTISLGSARVFIKNYTSISITGTTAKLAFSNPHAEGTVIILRSQGGVTLTSTNNPLIDLTTLGGTGGAGGNGQTNRAVIGTNGKGVGGGFGGMTPLSAGMPGAGGGGGGSLNKGSRGDQDSGFDSYPGQGGFSTQALINSLIYAEAGGGGGGGSGGSNNAGAADDGGAGGAGAGGLVIECAGAYNFTGTINASGTNGSNAANNTGTGAGGGGGGGGGKILVIYNTLTADSGTYTVAGGTHGTGTNSGGNGGDGSDGIALRVANSYF